MQITIYSGFSKENNSTKQPSGGIAVNCVLKEDTSIINPVFILQGANLSTNYVKWNDRYYFVDDVVSIRNDAVELHCHVDAMASWKSAIGSSSQYVTRAASAYNDKIIDGKYPALAGAEVDITTLPGDFASTFNPDNGSYVVGIIGDQSGSSSGVTYYSFTGSNSFDAFVSELFQGNWLDVPIDEISIELQKYLINPFQYIVSCVWYPMSIGGTSTPVKFGYWSTSAEGYLISESSRIKPYTSGATALPRHPQTSSLGRYVNSSPFTEHLLTVYSFGDIPIPAEYFVDSSICYVNLYVDIFSGTAQLTVTNSDQYVFLRSFGEFGVQIPISAIRTNPIATALGIWTNNASSYFSQFTGGNAFSENPAISLGASVLGAASAVSDAITCKSAKVMTQGSFGSAAAYEYPARIVTSFHEICKTDPEHLGRPLMQRVSISSLHGFIQVENPDMDIPATQAERDAIISYMQSGFFYE